MKKIIKAVCSALCVTAMAMPATVLADPASESEEIADDVTMQQELPDDYHLAFVTGDFGLQAVMTTQDQPFGAMVMFIIDRHGKTIKDAQVVTTVIDGAGRQLMQRALPLKGGYLIDTMRLPPGDYRMEAEVVTNGQLLADQFVFRKA